MHLSQAITGFCRYLHMRGCASGTERSYGYLLEQWGRWLAAHQIAWHAVTLEQIETFLEQYRETHSRTSTALFSTCLRSFYKWAQRRKHVSISPAADLEPITRDRPYPRALTDAQVHLLLAALERLRDDKAQRNRLIVRMFLFTGLRLAELASLEWTDIDLQANTIIVRAGKGGNPRLIPINATLATDIRAFHPQPDGPVWVCRRGKLSAAGISEMFRKVIQQEIGLKGVTAHVLRHTYGTKLRRQGADLRSIQVLLGHAEPRTTAIYTTVYDEELHQATALLSDAW